MKMMEILLVEDNEFDAEMTIDALKSKNLANNLIHMNNGEKALDFIFCRGEFSGAEFDINTRVILLDIKMPKVGGMEVLAKIRSNEKTKLIPVVMLTSSAEDPDIERSYELGANAYIVKPVDFDKFNTAIQNIGLFWILINQIPKKNKT